MRNQNTSSNHWLRDFFASSVTGLEQGLGLTVPQEGSAIFITESCCELEQAKEKEETWELLFEEGSRFYQAGHEKNGMRHPRQSKRQNKVQSTWGTASFSVLWNRKPWRLFWRLGEQRETVRPVPHGLTNGAPVQVIMETDSRKWGQNRKPTLHTGDTVWRGKQTGKELTIRQVMEAKTEMCRATW